MKPYAALLATAALLAQFFFPPATRGYVLDSTVPKAGGCHEPDHRDVSSPLSRRWSTSLPGPQALLTVTPPNSSAQLDEVEATILEAFGIWTGVSGTTVNSVTHPGTFAPIARTSDPSACTNDQGTNADGLNTICFNQPSNVFVPGVLAFTRTVTADAPGVSVGSSGPSLFAGQILDADIQFRNDGQATFATPGALATPQGHGAYDLESLLTHELGHSLGFDHSAVWRAMMFPFAPPPGQFLGDRPASQAPDAPLADDDRTGLRELYPDPNDSVHLGSISGRILPANPFALALEPSPSPGQPVTGIAGAQVVAVDADTGAVVAGALGGWSCNASMPPTRFDGTFVIHRLPLGRNYKLYAEPIDGLAQPGDIANAWSSLCRSDMTPPCTSPPIHTNFGTRARPATP
jgi:hypothetical protein